MSNRLAHLLARTALEAATTRRLLHVHLYRGQLSEHEAKALHQEAWTRSVRSLTQASPAVEQVVSTVHEGEAHPG